MKDTLDTEFDTLDLPDKRLNTRARMTVVAFSAKPNAGAPSALTEAELEGYYRFVNNDRVSFDALLAAHAEATNRRASGRERVVVAHDTTDFRFSEEVPRAGLGPMENGGQGFYAHFSLAVADLGQALGVVGVDYWMRGSRTSSKKTRKQCYEDPEKESLCWMRAVHAAQKVFAGGPRLIHVMDRGADDYDILCELTTSGYGFVVRAKHDRRIVQSDASLKSFARDFEVRCERQVQLSSRRNKRPAKQRKLYPPRDVRTTRLVFAASSVTFLRPIRSRAELKEVTLNLVHVYEPDPPAGCESV